MAPTISPLLFVLHVFFPLSQIIENRFASETHQWDHTDSSDLPSRTEPGYIFSPMNAAHTSFCDLRCELWWQWRSGCCRRQSVRVVHLRRARLWPWIEYGRAFIGHKFESVSTARQAEGFYRMWANAAAAAVAERGRDTGGPQRDVCSGDDTGWGCRRRCSSRLTGNGLIFIHRAPTPAGSWKEEKHSVPITWQRCNNSNTDN